MTELKTDFVDLATVPKELNGNNFVSPPPPINQMTLDIFSFFFSLLDDNTRPVKLICRDTDTT